MFFYCGIIFSIQTLDKFHYCFLEEFKRADDESSPAIIYRDKGGGDIVL